MVLANAEPAAAQLAGLGCGRLGIRNTVST